MTFGRWFLGVALLAAIATSLALGARAVRRRFAPELDGPTAVLADAILAISALVVIAELLGLVGLLDPVPLLLGALAAGAAAARTGTEPERAPARARSGSVPVVAWISFAGAGLVVAAYVRRTLVSLDLGIGGVDSLWYHLPFAARFARDGTAEIPYVDLEFLTAFYPANVELVHGVGMALFGTAAISPLLTLGALALGLLAGWCLGRPYGVAPATLLAAALAFGVPALFESQAGEAKNDVAALAFLLAGVVLLTAARGRGAVALAGAAAGLAVGTKLSLLAPVGALFVAVVVLRRGQSVAFAGAALATGGFWFVRNLFATGNPLPWLGPLPQPAEARSEETARTLAEYATDADAWDTYFLPALDDVLGPVWPLLVALAVGGALAALVKGDRTLRALGAVALVALVAYLVTPSSAAGPEGEPIGFALNVRYAIPGLLLGLCLLVIVLRRWTAVVVGVLAVALVLTQVIPDPIWAFEHRRKALALLVVGLGLAALLTRIERWRVVAAAAAVVAVAALWPLERDFLRHQYTATLQPYTSWQAFGMTPVYAWAREQHGARIALSGTTGSFFQYPLHGPELDNDVELVGEHGPHGSFTPVEDCAAYERAVGGSTHAVVTPYLDIWDPYRPLPAPELGCIRAMGGREILTSGEVRVFALP